MGSDPQYAKYPNLSLAQDVFTITNPSSNQTAQQAALKKLQDGIAEHKMAPLYRYLAHPAEGILNFVGEGSAGRPVPVKPRRASITGGNAPAKGMQIPWDEKLYGRLKKENEEELESFQKEEDEAAEKAGDTEVQAARGKRAEFWARVGDKVSGSLAKVSYIDTNESSRRKLWQLTRLSSKKLAYLGQRLIWCSR